MAGGRGKDGGRDGWMDGLMDFLDGWTDTITIVIINGVTQGYCNTGNLMSQQSSISLVSPF